MDKDFEDVKKREIKEERVDVEFSALRLGSSNLSSILSCKCISVISFLYANLFQRQPIPFYVWVFPTAR